MAHSRSLPYLSTVHMDNYELIDTVLHRWPTLPTYTFTHEGETLTGTLLGLNEAIIVVRRMWAYNLRLLPTPELGVPYKGHLVTNPLLRLACSDLSSLGSNHSLLIKFVLDLREESCFDQDPSFETILNDEMLSSIWAKSEMRFFQSKMLASTNNGVSYTVRDWPDFPHSSDELLVFKGDMELNKFFEEQFILRLDDGIWSGCCNFPAFIRVKYIARRLEDGSELPRFKDIRTLEIDALKLPRSDLRENRRYVMGRGKRTRRSYRLIACVFERSKNDQVLAVRTYTLQGRPIIPLGDWDVELEEIIGMPGTTCFLFYAMCHQNDCNPEIDPSMGASNGGTKRESTKELHSPPKRFHSSDSGDPYAGPSNAGEAMQITTTEEWGAPQQGSAAEAPTPYEYEFFYDFDSYAT